MLSGRWEEEEEPIARVDDDVSFLGALKLRGEDDDKETVLKFCWVFEELRNPVGIDKFKLLEAIVDINMNLGYQFSLKYSAAEAHGGGQASILWKREEEMKNLQSQPH